MKTLLNPWFLFFSLLWLMVQATRHLGYSIPYANSYLSDAAAVPVIAQLGLWFLRVAIIKSHNYVLAPWHVVFIIVYLTLLFEVALPHYSPRYTGDGRDVLLYALGGLFFYKVMNKPLIKE